MVDDAPFKNATPLLDDPPALRERAQQDGFLFFRGLLPRAEVMNLRRQFLEILDRHGWLQKGRDLMDGIGDPEAVARIPREEIAFCGVGIPREAYAEVQKLEDFHALAHHPALMELYTKLFNGEVLPHPRNIARLMMPSKSNVPTPPHQDFIHIQGTKNVWTCWFPVGDCPVELGGLSIHEASHTEGVLPVRQAEGAGNAEVVIDEAAHPWVGGDYEAGDVVTFTSLTVHKSNPNQLGNAVRLSCDYRYQRVDEPIHESSLLPHCGMVGWDEIYEGWRREDLQHYWKRHELTFAEWDVNVTLAGQVKADEGGYK